MSLADKKCEPCHGGTKPLSSSEYAPMLRELKDWQVIENHKLHKSVKTGDFKQALDLANKVGAIAEEQGHHPDLLVRWGELGIDMWTHAVNGLSEADFVMAAKIDRAL
jgi:4a-hydroxytetrahydrobiopterin dehydratase